MCSLGDTYITNIEYGNFNFHAFFEEAEEFCRRRGMVLKEIRAIQLLVEEVVVNHLLKHTDSMNFEIRCNAEERYADIRFEYVGEQYNLFEAEEPKDISVVLIRCLTKEYQYEFHESDQKNEMLIVLQFIK